MCGIFGWASLAGTLEPAVSVTWAENCLTLFAHRGPDDCGWSLFHRDGSLLTEKGQNIPADAAHAALILGHTRLSVIDLSRAGRQPRHSPDGRYTLVYNGEIYNYQELRQELIAQGAVFSSRSDSEVLLQALLHWGPACLGRCVGMFAFALHDARERTILLGRDFFGIKPLYYHFSENAFAFASEPSALLALPGFTRRVDAQQAYDYLCFGRYDQGDRTFFQHIRRLAPAHTLLLHLDSKTPPVPEPYWQPDLSRRSPLSFTEASLRLRELFLDSVRLHLRSDVPLGVALSGGIDSSSITCAVRCIQPDTELHTFSFIAKDFPQSEEQWARLAAERTHATRHFIEADANSLARDLDDMILRQGEPFSSTSIYAQYKVFQLARQTGITVTLDGQGADELLAGYEGYPGQRMASLLLHGDLAGAYRFLQAKSTWPGVSRKGILTKTFGEFTPDRLRTAALRLAGRPPLPGWIDRNYLHDHGLRPGFRDRRNEMYPCRDKVRQILAYQLTWAGLQQLLRHGDRNSMAFSIESRVPFLTKEIAEFCLSLPENYLIGMNGRTKSVFREAMRGIVPDAILDRRDKIGFATPEARWLRGLTPQIESALSEAADIPCLNMAAVRKEWLAGSRERLFNSARLWRWVNYIRWIQLMGVAS